MGNMPDCFQQDYFETEEYDPGYEPGAGTYTINKTSKPDPDFYYQEFKDLFKIIEIEHETPKAFLFHTEKGNFWCPKKLVRIKDVKNIFSWKIWKNIEYKFIPNETSKGSDK